MYPRFVIAIVVVVRTLVRSSISSCIHVSRRSHHLRISNAGKTIECHHRNNAQGLGAQSRTNEQQCSPTPFSEQLAKPVAGRKSAGMTCDCVQQARRKDFGVPGVGGMVHGELNWTTSLCMNNVSTFNTPHEKKEEPK